MKSAASRRLLIVELAAVLLMLFAVPSADAQVKSRQPRRAQIQTATDVVTFQTNLQNLVGWLSQTKTNNPNQQAVVNDLQQQINSLTPDQMTQLSGYADAGAFNGAVTTLTSSQPAPLNLPPTDPPINLALPQYGICAPRVGPPQIPSDPGTEKALLTLIEVLQVVQIAADNFENLNIAILGEEVNVPQVVIAIVADELVFAVQTVKDEFEFCDINAEASEVTAAWMNTIVIDTDIANLAGNVTTDFTQINNQLTAINTDIDNHIASIAGNTINQFTQTNNQILSLATSLTNQLNVIDVDIDNHIAATDADLNNHLARVDADVNNTTTAIGTDINNHVTQLDSDLLNRGTQIINELTTFQTLDVRLEIEHVLTSGLSVGLFELPSANGGYLETVRAIVADAISKLLTGGQSVATATHWMALGDTALAAKQYKSAYQNYAAAYQTAVK